MMQVVMKFAATIYGIIISIRGALYDYGLLRSYKSRLTVISVGNITAGGNGKTPLCIFLARELQVRGYRPAILSRGYGGKRRGPYRVAQSDSPLDVGDEPALLARLGLSTFIARSRVAGVRYIESLGAHNLVILDDGLQHRALQRDVDIVSIFSGSEAAIAEFVRGSLLPLGLFREKREKALARASLVVVSRRSLIPERDACAVDSRISRLLPPSLKAFSCHLEVKGVRTLVGDEVVTPRRVHVCTAIAKPEGFVSSLETLGFSIGIQMLFPDHHIFTEKEIRKLLCQHGDAVFVCTTKDAVKLGALSLEICSRFAVLDVSASVTPRDEFFTLLERLITGSECTSE